MNNLPGAVATGLYNVAGAFLLAHAFTGWQPLLTAADTTGHWADRFTAAQNRADAIRDGHTYTPTEPAPWEKP